MSRYLQRIGDISQHGNVVSMNDEYYSIWLKVYKEKTKRLDIFFVSIVVKKVILTAILNLFQRLFFLCEKCLKILSSFLIDSENALKRIST